MIITIAARLIKLKEKRNYLFKSIVTLNEAPAVIILTSREELGRVHL